MPLDAVAAPGNNIEADGAKALRPALEKLTKLEKAYGIEHILVTNSTKIPPRICPIPADRLVDHVLRVLLSALSCPQTAVKGKRKQVNRLVVRVAARGIEYMMVTRVCIRRTFALTTPTQCFFSLRLGRV